MSQKVRVRGTGTRKKWDTPCGAVAVKAGAAPKHPQVLGHASPGPAEMEMLQCRACPAINKVRFFINPSGRPPRRYTKTKEFHMRTFMRTAAIVAAGAATIALAGCGSAGNTAASGGNLPDGIPETIDGEGRTLTVWIMQDDYSESTLEAIKKEFTERTGAEADVQVQQWEGIATKLSTALGTSTPPDIVDIGNTQVAGYAANGALLDVTDYKEDLQQGNTWLGGLEDPATID